MGPGFAPAPLQQQAPHRDYSVRHRPPSDPRDHLGERHWRPVERWVNTYHPDLRDQFAQVQQSGSRRIVDTWLRRYNETLDGIIRQDDAMQDQLELEYLQSQTGGVEGPFSATMAYGEESGRGALANLRQNPGMARQMNRYVATTPGDRFPNDPESRRVQSEFEQRGGEMRTRVDVRQSPYDLDSNIPYNMSNLEFRYPRTDRGSNPSTAQVVSSYVDRVGETGRGDLAIPRADMYPNPATRNSLYGARMFQGAMDQSGVRVSGVRPGPEDASQLGLYGYTHRMTDRADERTGGVRGKTMELERGDGERSMDAGERRARRDERRARRRQEREQEQEQPEEGYYDDER